MRVLTPGEEGEEEGWARMRGICLVGVGGEIASELRGFTVVPEWIQWNSEAILGCGGVGGAGGRGIGITLVCRSFLNYWRKFQGLGWGRQ